MYKRQLKIKQGDTVSLSELAEKLVFAGYSRYDQVDGVSPVSYTHLDVYKRQAQQMSIQSCGINTRAFRAALCGTG